MKHRYLLISLLLLPLTLAHAFTNIGHRIDQEKILANTTNLDPQALKYAIKGYEWALEHHQVNNPNILTVIDFNLPSDAKRVWVIDLNTSRTLMNLYTTQGKNSGSYYATRFSNQPSTNETSLGVYKTLNTYSGKHGLSERLQGLEQGINDNAYRRAIVIHPAPYASPSFVKVFHRAGRSWGCFAINPAESNQFIRLTKGGSIIFAYASPERNDRYLAKIG